MPADLPLPTNLPEISQQHVATQAPPTDLVPMAATKSLLSKCRCGQQRCAELWSMMNA
jgi:hypothetical protein